MKCKFCILLFLLVAAYSTVSGQINPVRAAMARMEKKNWQSARQLLMKSLRKDSLNTESKFILSKWFIEPSNPDFHIDSAYNYSLGALRDFTALDSKSKERLQRFPIDSALLISNRDLIDSLAFERAKKINQEADYNLFLEKFTTSRFRHDAIDLRDEVCFLEALRLNTEQSYKKYIDRYPSSKRVTEARERYQKLLFDNRTRDASLKSFQQFAKEYPESPYYNTALRQIFEISTASGNPTDFEEFVLEFPESSFSKIARDILFHKAKSLRSAFPANLLNDSLQSIVALEAKPWIPFLKNGKYGFMDVEGKERMTERFEEIENRYLCGNVTDEILVTTEGLFARSGKQISDASHQVVDIGTGFLQLESDDCKQLIHKSGRVVIEDCFDQAKILLNRFIKITTSKDVSLYALNGKLLTSGWRDIKELEGLILFDNHAKWIMALPSQVSALADGQALPTDFVFDKVTAVDQHLILVSIGSLEAMLNPKLEFVVPLGRQILQSTPIGVIRKQNETYDLTSVSKELEGIKVNSLDFVDRWLVLRAEEKKLLYDLSYKKIVARNLDTLWFNQKMAWTIQNDSLVIFFPSGGQIKLMRNSKIQFVPSPDTIRYFYTEGRAKKDIFDIATGKKIFNTDFDEIESLTATVFRVTRRGKKFLLGNDGKPISTLDFDLLVKTSPHRISLVKNKRFGFFETRTNKLITPQFDRNTEELNGACFIAYKNGKAGILNHDGVKITEFEFDELKPWTDSVVWAKQNGLWKLYDFYTHDSDIEQIKDFNVVLDRPNESLAMIQKGGLYGIVSNKRGLVLPPSFNDVINLGSEDEPLYFTEKRVEEAGIFVVIYFDKTGNLIRKQVYEEEEYDRIFCDN